MKVANFFTKCTLLVLIMMLTITVPKTYAVYNNTYTGPNTFFMAYKFTPLTPQTDSDGEEGWYCEIWTFAVRDLDTPIGKASLSDVELFAASYVENGYRPDEGYYLKTIVFGTLEHVEDGGWEHWEPNQEYKVSGGGSFTVRPATGPDYEDWEKVIFKISAIDSYGSKITVSGTYICASGPPVYYISLTIKLTGQVYEYNSDNDSWIPTGRVETHTLKLKGYPEDYYYLKPYYISTYAYPDQLTYFPEMWPFSLV